MVGEALAYEKRQKLKFIALYHIIASNLVGEVALILVTVFSEMLSFHKIMLLSLEVKYALGTKVKITKHENMNARFDLQNSCYKVCRDRHISFSKVFAQF